MDITHEYWMIYFDGLVMASDSRARVVLISPDGSRLRYVTRLQFLASNNAVEYKALINGLCVAVELGATRLYVRGDSELVIDQVMKEFSCKSPLMVEYCQEVPKLEGKFRGIELHHVPQKDNAAADFLTKLAARRVLSLDGVFINDYPEPSARIVEDLTPLRLNPDKVLEGSSVLTRSDPDQAL
ncbi:uncharacterized protein [Miscanthus floridulus]|uniref:uncharacterized protein n=1 Tax=Miscanthus floridulus TaxID=154761 RepID=UPI00345AF82D